MMHHRVALALGALLVGSATVFAQADPLVRPLPPAAIGTETLGKHLRTLGYVPKALSPDVYQINVDKDRWPVFIMLSLSTDGQRLWLESKFAPVEAPEKVPAATWKRLVEANERIGPAHFAFDPQDKRIHLYKSFDNRDVTTQRLQKEIDAFDTIVRTTHEYWRSENFKAPAEDKPVALLPPTALLPVPATETTRADDSLLGEWVITEIKVEGKSVPATLVSQRKPSVTFRLPREGERGSLMAELQTSPGVNRTVQVVIRKGTKEDEFDFIDEKDQVEKGIAKRDGANITACFAPIGEPRPTSFEELGNDHYSLLVLKKAK